MSALSERRLGIVYALTAYGMWGLIPLYFRAVKSVSPFEVLSHRIVWSFALLLAVLGVRRDFGWLEKLQQRPRIVWSFLASATVLSINWFVYIWSVAAGRVVDASLGYFINPLLSVLLAVVVLKERLRALQWAAVSVAALGVLWLTLLAGQLPWIGLALATSFGCYGLLRKMAALEALAGLTLETILLLPIALGYLLWLSRAGTGAWSGAEPALRVLLVAGGPITAIPLLCFAAGARRIPLSLLGILQYLGPTLQLVLGIWVFAEPFSKPKLLGFALIWLAVLLFSLEGLWFTRSRGESRARSSS
jgi:chloramphenicol-sensitive protein RarD